MSLMAYSPFGISEQLSENQPLTICLENPAHFRKFVKDLNDFCDGISEEFAFLDGEGSKWISPSEIQIISNPSSVDFNSRQVSNAVIKEARQICQVYELVTAEMLAAFGRFSEAVMEKLPYLTIASDFNGDINGFLKLCNFHFFPNLASEEDVSVIQEWIKISSQLLRNRLMVFLNPSSFYTVTELDEIVKTSIQTKMVLLFIEPADEKAYPNGDVLIVDSDLCLIKKSRIIR